MSNNESEQQQIPAPVVEEENVLSPQPEEQQQQPPAVDVNNNNTDSSAQQQQEDELTALLAEETNNNNNNTSAVVEEYLQEQQTLSNTNVDAAPAAAATTTTASSSKKMSFPLPAGTTLETLFGPHFKPRPNPIDGSEVPVDPAEIDIASVIQEQFGIEDWASLAFLPMPDVKERVIDPNLLVFHEGEGAAKAIIEEDLEAYIIEQEGLVARDEVAEIFGGGAVKLVVDSLLKGAAGQQQPTQIVSLPRPPKAQFIPPTADQKTQEDDKNSESWLLHLPTIYPNRRSAHIERGQYVPGHTSVKKQSTDRAIYTPLNVLRWAYDETRNVSLSNSRLVKWSSGVWTLHVGTDVYAIAPDKTQSLVVVGQEIENTVPEFAPPGVDDASRIFVETAPYTKRVQLLPSAGDAGHSVENFLVAENRISSVKNAPSSVVKLVTAPVTVAKPPVPGQPKDKKAVRIEGSDELAEYLAMQDKERDRILRQQNGGRAPTVFDRLAFDAQVLDTVRQAQMADGGDFNALLNKFKEEVAAATAASTRNQQFGDSSYGGGNGNSNTNGGRGKLDRRDLDIDDDEDEDDNEEEENLGQLLSSGTRRNREGEDVNNESNNNSSAVEDESFGSMQAVLERLVQMKTTPGLSSELAEEIDGLYSYINGDNGASAAGLSVESMEAEIRKIEDKILQQASEAALLA